MVDGRGYRLTVEGRLPTDRLEIAPIADEIIHHSFAVLTRGKEFPGCRGPYRVTGLSAFLEDPTAPASTEEILISQGAEILALHAALDVAAEEVKSLRAFKASVDQALNSGDGVYRP